MTQAASRPLRSAEAASARPGAELGWLRAQLQAWWRSLRRGVRSWGLQSLQEPGLAMSQGGWMQTAPRLLWPEPALASSRWAASGRASA